MNSLIANRIQKIRSSLSRNDIDTLLILVAENRRYLSGFTGEDTQFDESAGALLINPDRLLLATDSRYELQAKIEAPLYEVACYKKGLFKELRRINYGFGRELVRTARYRFQNSRSRFLRLRLSFGI